MNRVYIPKSRGGRGLLNVENCHNTQVQKLRKYFLSNNLPLHRTLRDIDQNYSPLDLMNPNSPTLRNWTEMEEEWASKTLHGRYRANLKNTTISMLDSNTYLKAGYLFPETEGSILAIQDQVVPTLNYRKYVLKERVESDLCRKCKRTAESIQHITAGCSILAPRQYLARHDEMGKIYHQAIALGTGLMEEGIEWYKYNPKDILENAEYKLYWNITIITDRSVQHNRPDMVLFKKKEEEATIIDFITPLDENVQKAYLEKKQKYEELAYELRQLYKLKQTKILPLVISVNGLIHQQTANCAT